MIVSGNAGVSTVEKDPVLAILDVVTVVANTLALDETAVTMVVVDISAPDDDVESVVAIKLTGSVIMDVVVVDALLVDETAEVFAELERLLSAFRRVLDLLFIEGFRLTDSTGELLSDGEAIVDLLIKFRAASIVSFSSGGLTGRTD